MKIGITSGYWLLGEEAVADEKKMQENLKRLKSIGVDGMDYGVNNTQVTYGPRKECFEYHERCRKQLNDCGLEVFQTHLSWPINAEGEQKLTEKSLDQLKREVELTALLGAKYAVVHPIRLANMGKRAQEDLDANLDAFTRLLPTLKEFDVVLAVENVVVFDWPHFKLGYTGYSRPEDMCRYLDLLDPKYFCACLDTGHMNCLLRSPAEAARMLGSRLKVLHVHDNFDLDDHHLAPTLGWINWRDFAAALKEIGYKGVFSLECGYAEQFSYSERAGWLFLEAIVEIVKSLIKEL